VGYRKISLLTPRPWKVHGGGDFPNPNLQRKNFEPKLEYPEGWGQTNNKPLWEEYGYYLEQQSFLTIKW